VQIRVPELKMQRQLRLVHRRAATLSHAAVAFLKTVRAFAAEHGAPFHFTPEA
jgi:hypothetical protein